MQWWAGTRTVRTPRARRSWATRLSAWRPEATRVAPSGTNMSTALAEPGRTPSAGASNSSPITSSVSHPADRAPTASRRCRGGDRRRRLTGRTGAACRSCDDTAMAFREIRVVGDPVLRTPCEEVTEIDGRVRSLVEDLLETVDADGRAGLAANQIGVGLRAFSWNIDDEIGYVINPRIVELSEDEYQDGDEGCLSVPGLWFPTRRAWYARVEGIDLDRKKVVVEGEELMAPLPPARGRPPRRHAVPGPAGQERPQEGHEGDPRAALTTRRPRHAPAVAASGGAGRAFSGMIEPVPSRRQVIPPGRGRGRWGRRTSKQTRRS